MTREWEQRSLAWVKGAVARARAYAQEQGVPLTAERLAAELGLHVTEFQHLAMEDVLTDPKQRAKQDVLREALEEANASVVEQAMKRGSSTNMHVLYLKQYAGYRDREKDENTAPVMFSGEQDLT